MREKVNDPKWLGQKFGRLTVVGFQHRGKKWYWECACECGGVTVTQAYLVKSGHATSCGCYQKEVAGKANITHGQSKSRLYRIYNAMKNRCYNPNQAGYENYGAIGITVCEEWLSSYEPFYTWAIANGYSDDLTIDRIDNSKGYSPENCRWVTRQEQNMNTRHNHWITIDGVTKPLSEWVRDQGLNYHTVSFRIHQKGMSPKEALGL